MLWSENSGTQNPTMKIVLVPFQTSAYPSFLGLNPCFAPCVQDFPASLSLSMKTL
jgi:hypothetical protein